ncbi:uncharacterized protein METZ01_LOCUS411552, partial [marine metagenome]
MAKVKIQGNAAGTGVFSIVSPDSDTNRTLTLPDTTGTLLDENSSLPAANLTGTLPAISGANLTGISSVGGATGVDFNDNIKIRSGTGNDLEIYHDGTNSYIKNATGALG